MVRDLVCGMGVEEDDLDTIIKVLNGRKFYFCSVECMLLFSKSPGDYESAAPKNTARDVVCGMEVDENNPPSFIEVNGTTYYFCSNSCKLEFVQHLEQFIGRTYA